MEPDLNDGRMNKYKNNPKDNDVSNYCHFKYIKNIKCYNYLFNNVKLI